MNKGVKTFLAGKKEDTHFFEKEGKGAGICSPMKKKDHDIAFTNRKGGSNFLPMA